MLAVLLLKRLVIPLIVLGGLFLGANVVAERYAEDRIAATIRSTFDLQTEPEVDIQGFPVLLQLVRGRVPAISFEAADVGAEGLTLRRVSVAMDAIRARNGILSGDLAVVVGRGAVRAEATDEAVTTFLRRRGERATVRFLEGGRATVRATRTFAGARHRIVAQGRVRLRRGALSFTPTSVTVDGERPNPLVEAEAKRQARFSERIPELPGGVSVTGFESREGHAVFLAELTGFEVGPGSAGRS